MTTHVRGLSHAFTLPLGSVDAATAHAHPKIATPAPDAQAATAMELGLGFTERVNLKITDLVLAGSADEVPTGASGLPPGDDEMPSVPVTGQLVPGACEVDWHTPAADGRRATGNHGSTVVR